MTGILQQNGHTDGRDDDVHQRNAAHSQRPVDAELDRHGREAAEHHSDHQQRNERERQQVVRCDAKHRAQHDDLALREMQHAGRPDDHRETERDEAINAADREATDKELDELRAAHGVLRSVMDYIPVTVGTLPIKLKMAKTRGGEYHRRVDLVARRRHRPGDVLKSIHLHEFVARHSKKLVTSLSDHIPLIPMKPVMNSNLKTASCSYPKRAGVPI